MAFAIHPVWVCIHLLGWTLLGQRISGQRHYCRMIFSTLRKKHIFITAALIIGSLVTFYYKILYPKHFCEYEIWGSQPKALPIFMFHENDVHELEEIFTYITTNNYKTIGLEEALDIFNGYKKYTGKEILLTFDDGKLALWTVMFPLIKKFNLKGIAFVSPGLVEDKGLRKHHSSKLTPQDLENYCSWKELRVIEDYGLDIQSHSHMHKHKVFYNPTSHKTHQNEIRESLRISKQTLEKEGFDKQLLFCAPFGSVSNKLLELSQKAGYKYVLGVRAHNESEKFYGQENDTFEKRNFLLRKNFRSIFSLPGKGREGVMGRIWRRMTTGGDRSYGS